MLIQSTSEKCSLTTYFIYFSFKIVVWFNGGKANRDVRRPLTLNQNQDLPLTLTTHRTLVAQSCTLYGHFIDAELNKLNNNSLFKCYLQQTGFADC